MIIETLLQPLKPYLDDERWLEICAVREKNLALEDAQGFYLKNVSFATYDYWYRLCRALANRHGMYFHPIKQPRLSVQLFGGHRLEAILGPQVSEHLSVAIRLKRNKDYKLQDFGLNTLQKKYLVEKIETKASILVSGSTGSGKTSLLNAIVQCISKEERLLSLEDTQEIDLTHHRLSASYLVSRHDQSLNSYKKMIDHLMRARPDRILLGELSIDNAQPFTRLLNTGHRGLLATIHAASPDLAIEAIAQNIKLCGNNANGIKDLAKKTLDIIIQVEKKQHHRQVVQLWDVPKGKEVA